MKTYKLKGDLTVTVAKDEELDDGDQAHLRDEIALAIAALWKVEKVSFDAEFVEKKDA